MNYHLKSSVHRPRRRFRFVLLFVVAVVAFVFVAPPAFLTRLAHTGAMPLWRAGDSVRDLGAAVSAVSLSKQELLQRNQALEEQLQSMQLAVLDRNLLREENRELKEMLRRVDEEEVVLARVLTKPNRSVYDTLIIDAGTEHGVVVGDHVLAGDRVVIGEVARVFGKSAVVSLFSSPGQQFDVEVGTTGISETAEGRGGGNFAVNVPRDVAVTVGDTIVAPGISDEIFGTVEELYVEPASSFKTILFKSPVNIFELRFVGVVIHGSIEIIEAE